MPGGRILEEVLLNETADTAQLYRSSRIEAPFVGGVAVVEGVAHEPDGRTPFRRIHFVWDDLDTARQPDPARYLEHGFRQGETVRALLKRAGFGNVATTVDLAGRPRVSEGQIGAPP